MKNSLSMEVFTEQMGRLTSVFKTQKLDQEKALIRGGEYYQALSHCYPEDLTQAVNWIIEERQNEWFPTPAEILKYARRAAKERKERTLKLPNPVRVMTDVEIQRKLERMKPAFRVMAERVLKKK